ncbi:MAG: hypothetical protein M1812_004027 [Candelaria pacifica]|nr:MAG: hypothetical protein M1812_004027 [Candelaria pacifica]
MPTSSLIVRSPPSIPIELLLYLFAHVECIWSLRELRLVNRHFQVLFKLHEATISAQIIRQYFAFEAKCFPPSNVFRGYIHETEPEPEPSRCEYASYCRDKGLCYRRNTYDYVQFLERRAHAVTCTANTIVDRLGMSEWGLYRNCVVLWCFTEGNTWSGAISTFLKLPKHVQLSFDKFLDELADGFSRVGKNFARHDDLYPSECSFLGHHQNSETHPNYEYQLNVVYLPDDTTCEEIKWLGVPKLYAKWMILTVGAQAMQAYFAGSTETNFEVLYEWDNYITIGFCEDPWGGYLEVRFPIRSPGSDDLTWRNKEICNPIKALELALELPEGASLPPTWIGRVRNNRVTATFHRALYWNREGWFFNDEDECWWYRHVKFYGDWTEFGFDISALFHYTNDCWWDWWD